MYTNGISWIKLSLIAANMLSFENSEFKLQGR